MGKSWFKFLTCFSPNDKNGQKLQKSKKRWLGKQKRADSGVLIPEEIPSIQQPSTTAPPPPPLAPAAAPQPSVPPPSPPPQPSLLPSTSTHLPASTTIVDDEKSKEEQTRQALALATVIATEAAVVAAHAAAEVVRLATATRQNARLLEESAAVKIQTAYRCYMARRTLLALRGMNRLKELLQGQYVKRQATAMLRSMQTLTRLQTQIQERRNRLSEENQARHKLLQQKQPQKEQHGMIMHSMNEREFDVSNKSKAQIEARATSRKEAAVRRERALAYSYSHQQTWRNSSKLPHQSLMDPNNTHWGWSWLERWMASRPWDTQTKTPYVQDDQTSVKSASQRKPTVHKTISKAAVSKTHRAHRHNLGGGGPSSVSKDDESVGSSSSLRSSLGPSKGTAQSRRATQAGSKFSSQRKKSIDDQKNKSTSAFSRTIPRTLSKSEKAKDSRRDSR